MNDDIFYSVALTLIPKVGAVTARNLMSYCGGARAVFEATEKELKNIPGIGAQLAHNIRNSDALFLAERELDFIEAHGIRVLFYTDPAYPQRLKHLPDSPPLLYYKGNADLNVRRTVAIVGTRRPSPQGVHLCEEIVENLLPYGVSIISGLAFGIDIAAHRACLAHSIPTIGCVAHGLQRIYPVQHTNAALEMIENGGLLSEYPSQTAPDRERFPMRNRIIAGLCDALIVVETQRQGGSMISAKMANDYHRDVFAVPGRIRDKSSEGCNLLIKSHRANLMEGVNDLAYVMRWEKSDAQNGVQRELFPDLDPKEEAVVELLKQQDLLPVDQISVSLQQNNSELAALLLGLEFKGIVRTLPGKRYTLV
ncbi:MAG: DNA-processing protein DprA [Phaeodactylibacter sp.]|uniref:DNA-processing protein DprA n=1 Tax=Phaeodactylibacter sp. TaxID=1940289 RepID=UPI0032EF6CCD